MWNYNDAPCCLSLSCSHFFSLYYSFGKRIWSVVKRASGKQIKRYIRATWHAVEFVTVHQFAFAFTFNFFISEDRLSSTLALAAFFCSSKGTSYGWMCSEHFCSQLHLFVASSGQMHIETQCQHTYRHIVSLAQHIKKINVRHHCTWAMLTSRHNL